MGIGECRGRGEEGEAEGLKWGECVSEVWTASFLNVLNFLRSADPFSGLIARGLALRTSNWGGCSRVQLHKVTQLLPSIPTPPGLILYGTYFWSDHPGPKSRAPSDITSCHLLYLLPLKKEKSASTDEPGGRVGQALLDRSDLPCSVGPVSN